MKDQKIKQDLVDAYKICAMLKMDDLTYTHITARPQNAQYFYILAFGNMFDQASINNLIKVDIARGEVVEGNEAKSIEKINLLLEDQKETAVIYTEQEELISVLKHLKSVGFTLLVDIFGVDYPQDKKRIELVKEILIL